MTLSEQSIGKQPAEVRRAFTWNQMTKTYSLEVGVDEIMVTSPYVHHLNGMDLRLQTRMYLKNGRVAKVDISP